MLRGVEVASDELIERVRIKGRQIVIALPDSEELRYLDAMQANANVGGAELNHIILREQPRKIEVLEEFLHGTQIRIGLVNRLERKGLVAAEIHVKRFMVRHAALLALGPEDVEVLLQMLGDS